MPILTRGVPPWLRLEGRRPGLGAALRSGGNFTVHQPDVL